MKRLLQYSTHFAILISMLVLPTKTAIAERALPPPTSPLVISEIQTGGRTADNSEDGRQEFIELYNTLDAPLALHGLRLDYLSASHDGVGSPTRSLAVFQGTLAAHSFMLVSSVGYLSDADQYFTDTATSSSGFLARSGGHVRLADADGATMDLVGWGTASPIGNWWKAPEIPFGMSIQRILPLPGHYDSVFAAPTVQITPQNTTVDDGASGPDDIPTPPLSPTPTCTGIVLSELLPNAPGADAGKEFIEIYNPTSASVNLAGCSLRLGQNGIPFQLPANYLGPGAYRAFYDSQTGITLPNTTAQTVWLVTTDGEQSIQYAEDLAEDESWVLFEGMWQATKQATPGAANKLQATTLPVQRRNAVTAVTSCAAGKERNPETNRCRTVPVVATATLTPCKSGQERSVETNRCRSVQLAAASQPKPCPTGQERNAATNRCRKTVAGGVKNMAAVKDVSSTTAIKSYRWWIAGGVVVSVLGYALYEWRHDIRQKLYALRSASLAMCRAGQRYQKKPEK